MQRVWQSLEGLYLSPSPYPQTRHLQMLPHSQEGASCTGGLAACAEWVCRARDRGGLVVARQGESARVHLGRYPGGEQQPTFHQRMGRTVFWAQMESAVPHPTHPDPGRKSNSALLVDRTSSQSALTDVVSSEPGHRQG